MKRLNKYKILSLFFLIWTILGVEVFAKLLSDWPEDGILMMSDMKSTPILSAIKNAQHSIDLCLYHLDNEAIIDHLIEAKTRGVQGRLMLNKPSMFPASFEKLINVETSRRLINNGIETHFLKDYDYTLIHYKFMVLDNVYALI